MSHMRDRFGDYLSVKIKIFINEKKEKRVMLFLNRILYIKKKNLFLIYMESTFYYIKVEKEKGKIM